VLVDSGNPRKLSLIIDSNVDGRDDSGEALRIGIYIIFLEEINQGSGIVENMKRA